MPPSFFFYIFLLVIYLHDTENRELRSPSLLPLGAGLSVSPHSYLQSLSPAVEEGCVLLHDLHSSAQHMRGCVRAGPYLGAAAGANFSGLKAISPGLGLSSQGFLSELDVIRNTAESGQIGAGWGQQKKESHLPFLSPCGHHSATGKTRLPWQRCGSHLNTNFLLLLYILQTLSLAALPGTLY